MALVVPQLVVRCWGTTYIELCVLLYVSEGADSDSLACPVMYICNLEEG